MYAVIRTGGKQYKVSEGQRLVMVPLRDRDEGLIGMSHEPRINEALFEREMHPQFAQECGQRESRIGAIARELRGVEQWSQLRREVEQLAMLLT